MKNEFDANKVIEKLEKMTEKRMKNRIERLEEIRYAADREIRLINYYKDSKCPKCGKLMVSNKSIPGKKGTFNFVEVVQCPKCKYADLRTHKDHKLIIEALVPMKPLSSVIT